MNKLTQVYGIGFPNKGAELMLASVAQRADLLGLHTTDLCCLPGTGSDTGKATLAGLGVKEILKLPKLSNKSNLFVTQNLPKSLLQRYGFVPESAVVNLVDASGFAHSDQWGAAVQTRYINKFKACKDRGGKVVMLPQALGPFESDEIKRNMQTLMDHVDIVFARDESSRECLVRAGADNKLGGVYPDFTNLVSGYKTNEDSQYNDKFVIVPNARMIDKTSEQVSEQYLKMLHKLIQLLEKKGVGVVVFNHEGAQDLDLCKELVKSSKSAALLNESNPLRIKGILGEFRMGFSSRFHGVVSLLSQSVPSLCLGWSHKYQELYKDYCVEDLLIDSHSMLESIEDKLEELVANESALKLTLGQRSIALKTLSHEMCAKTKAVFNS